MSSSPTTSLLPSPSRLPSVLASLALVLLAVGLYQLQQHRSASTSSPPDAMALASIPHAFAAAVKQPATATLLFVHGLGDQGHGWSQMLSQQLAPTLPSLQVVCPHAPMGTLTVSGQRMPLWFDIKAPKTREHPELQDRDGMERTRAMLESVIKEEHEQGRKVVLGGFSQGAVMTMYAGLQSRYPLSGLMVLSGFVPQATTLPSLKSPTLPARLPIFQAHGTDDGVIDVSYGRIANAFLRSDALGLSADDIEYHEYAGLAHTTTPQELLDLTRWLQKIL